MSFAPAATATTSNCSDDGSSPYSDGSVPPPTPSEAAPHSSPPAAARDDENEIDEDINTNNVALCSGLSLIPPPVPAWREIAALSFNDDDDDEVAKKCAANKTGDVEAPPQATAAAADDDDDDNDYDEGCGGQVALTPTATTTSNGDDGAASEADDGGGGDDGDAAGMGAAAAAVREPSSFSWAPTLEAWLVRESTSSFARGGDDDDNVVPPPPPLPAGLLYEAKPVPNPPFWKRHALGIMIAIVAVFVALTATVAGVLSTINPEMWLPSLSTTSAPTSSPTPCPYPCDSCVRYAGPLFENGGCDGCSPPVDIDGEDSVVAAMGMESVDFFFFRGSKNGDGGGWANSTTTTFPIDYKVGGVGGSGVAVSGNYAVVGSPTEDGHAGAVYVYEKNGTDMTTTAAAAMGGWEMKGRIAPGDLGEGAQFGRYVDVDGDVMVVGSYDYQGSVYVYRRGIDGTWGEEAKLAPNLSMNKDFGGVAKVMGDRIAVGDRLYGYAPEGAVFLYEYDGISNAWNLNGPPGGIVADVDCDGRFGVNLALANDRDLMIGCPMEDKWTGAVYHYVQEERGGEYALRQKVTASGGAPGNRFGQTQQIDADGDVMVIGEYKNKGGRAYVYVREGPDGNWTEVAQIDAPSAESKYFGDSVALSGSRVLVASRDNVYLYDLGDCLTEDAWTVV